MKMNSEKQQLLPAKKHYSTRARPHNYQLPKGVFFLINAISSQKRRMHLAALTSAKSGCCCCPA